MANPTTSRQKAYSFDEPMAQEIVSPKDFPAEDLPAKPIHVQGTVLNTGIIPQVAPALNIFGDTAAQAPIPGGGWELGRLSATTLC